MRHPKARLYVHLVWATWDRAPLITPEIRDRIYPMMQRHASEMGANVIAIGGIEDPCTSSRATRRHSRFPTSSAG
jgi:putative transposase